MEILTYIILALALSGSILNVKSVRYCFLFWAFSDFAWGIVNYMKDIPGEVVYNAINVILDIYGFVWWKRIARFYQHPGVTEVGAKEIVMQGETVNDL